RGGSAGVVRWMGRAPRADICRVARVRISKGPHGGEWRSRTASRHKRIISVIAIDEYGAGAWRGERNGVAIESERGRKGEVQGSRGDDVLQQPAAAIGKHGQ